MQLGLFLKPHAVNFHTVFNWVLGFIVSSVDCTNIIHLFFFFLFVRSIIKPPLFFTLWFPFPFC